MDMFTNGWAGIEVADKAYASLEKNFIPFRISGAGPSKPGVPIWRYVKRINGGKQNRTFKQQTGDCCSMGATHAIEYGSVAGALIYGQHIEFKHVFPPFIYGVSRTAPDCGDGKLGRSAGSTGAWTAYAAQHYGVLFEDDEGVPAYSGNLADTWGSRGVPKEFYSLASDNLVKSTARLTSIDQIRDALINYHMCTIASSWAFKVSERDGVKLYVRDPRTSWGHQMSLIAWRDDPFPAAFELNSWGPDATGPQKEDEPLGGAWRDADELAKELKTGVEVYAYSNFDGFPAARSSAISFV